MGLISLIGSGLTAIGRAAGLVAPLVTTTAARTALQTAGRFATSPFVTSLAGGALGFAGAQAFGGGGVPGAVQPGVIPRAQLGDPTSQLRAAGEAGAQITELAGGRFMAVAANGDVQLFNRSGMAIRPQLIIPAGQRLPGGALVVSTRQNGALIGITKRRRRTAFRTEIRKVRSTIQGCRAVLAAAEKPRKRSSHA